MLPPNILVRGVYNGALPSRLERISGEFQYQPAVPTWQLSGADIMQERRLEYLLSRALATARSGICKVLRIPKPGQLVFGWDGRNDRADRLLRTTD